MALGDLLTQTATVVQTAAGAENPYGNPSQGAETRTDYPAFLQRRRTAEDTEGRDVQLADWLLFLLAEAVVSGRDRVEVEGVAYEMDGPPEVVRTPRGPHHIEAQLRSID